MSWPWKRSQKEDPLPAAQPAAGEPSIRASSPADPEPVIEALRQVDYSKFADLNLNDTPARLHFAPMTIIGLGSIGQAVTERLAERIPLEVDSPRPVSLLSITLRADDEDDFELPTRRKSILQPNESLSLEVPRGIKGFSWYCQPDSGGLARPDGRLALFHSLRLKPSPIWDNLTRVLMDRHPDVWLVGSAFDAESGALADLAHLVRIISAQQNYVPFIGLFLALPGQEWADSFYNRSAASLREITRILRQNTPRNYEPFAPESDNYALHGERDRSDDDSSAVLLAAPAQDSYGQQAADGLVERMATALFCLAQESCWIHPDVNLREVFRSNRSTTGLSGLTVHTLGIGIQKLPTPQLKDLVRARLTLEVLIGRQTGLVQTWSDYQLEYDEAAARLLLEKTGHDLLRLLAGIRGRLDFPDKWPAITGAELRLANTLYDEMQRLLEGPSAEKGLQRCASLVLGLNSLFENDLPAEIRTSLQTIVLQVKHQLEEWRDWGKAVRKDLDGYLKVSRDAWEHAFEQDGVHVVASPDLADEIFRRLTSDTGPRILDRVREYVRFAWKREGIKLTLGLDVLAPGWKLQKAPWSFNYQPQNIPEIWSRIYQVAAALTQEVQMWPCGLSDPLLHLPVPGSDDELAPLMLPYKLQKAGDVHALARTALLASGDAQWRKQSWLSLEEGARPVDINAADVGVILRLHFQTPLASAQLFPVMNSRYRSSSQSGTSLHVFPAEQLAFDLERFAAENVPFRERQAFLQNGLSLNTIDLLEQGEAVQVFVLAWCAGLVSPPGGRGIYTLHISSDEHGWCSPECDTPLHALVAFLGESMERREALLKGLSSDLAGITSEKVQERRSLVGDGWKSETPKDVDWFILVNGLLRRKKL